MDSKRCSSASSALSLLSKSSTDNLPDAANCQKSSALPVSTPNTRSIGLSLSLVLLTVGVFKYLLANLSKLATISASLKAILEVLRNIESNTRTSGK